MFNYTTNYYENSDNVSRDIIDLDFSFGIHPISGDIRKKVGVEAIKQSIRTLVLLNHYEKVFHPDIGCDVYNSVFELFEGNFTEELMKKYITKVITSYEPRVELNKIIINNQDDQNFLGITIIFTPIGEVQSSNVDIFLKILR